ncbi:UNVERIFIED_CONTAM: hypothetical protein PYX00_004244 [Menopon gallinae]|uniref:Vacuolar ATP synthase subunit S1 n=1 Tax=Menopon gallinae TaxID=328185 RepID=A0AAW2I3T9_9NEOP
MGLRNYFLFLSFIATAVTARDYVPVLLWGEPISRDSDSSVSGLSKLGTDEFYNYLLKKVKENRPNIVLFVEENLSLEDFSWKDVDDQGAFPLLSNMSKSSEDLLFFPSVRNPYKAVRKLEKDGYSWGKYKQEMASSLPDEGIIITVKLTEPDSLEGRPDLLRSHDSEISNIYSNLQRYSPNIIGIYTGNHSSWIDADVKYSRVKRSEPEELVIETFLAPSTEPLVLMDSNKTVLIAVSKPIIFRDGSETYNLSDTTITPTVQKAKGTIALDVNFKFQNKIAEVDFFFKGSGEGDWSLAHIIVDEKKDQILVPSLEIGAPKGYSYHCSRSVMFADKDNQVTLIMNNFQVQPWVKDAKFGPSIDCVPYFSIAIWSGLFVVFILTAVLAWAIVMIMDINTMDRFDDAKGKTITIASAE